MRIACISPQPDFAQRGRRTSRRFGYRIGRSLLSRFQLLDILVNNAGVQQRVCPLAEVTYEECRRVLELNLSGRVLLLPGGGAVHEAAGERRHINVAR